MAQIRLDSHRTENGNAVAKTLLSPTRKTINKAIARIANGNTGCGNFPTSGKRGR
jgi:hypothetical protein